MRIPDNASSDDAEWNGWNAINERLDIQELREGSPRSADVSASGLFAPCRELLGRYLRSRESAPGTASRWGFIFKRR